MGGYSFPPGIYFKLYTHRPLCDINSFAPRDYSKEKKADGGFRNSAIGNDVAAVKRNRTGIKLILGLDCLSFHYIYSYPRKALIVLLLLQSQIHPEGGRATGKISELVLNILEQL